MEAPGARRQAVMGGRERAIALAARQARKRVSGFRSANPATGLLVLARVGRAGMWPHPRHETAYTTRGTRARISETTS
jgi:hypothetical protein